MKTRTFLVDVITGFLGDDGLNITVKVTTDKSEHTARQLFANDGTVGGVIPNGKRQYTKEQEDRIVEIIGKAKPEIETAINRYRETPAVPRDANVSCDYWKPLHNCGHLKRRERKLSRSVLRSIGS